MGILKCKVCGGEINVKDGSSTVKCEFCGTEYTVPSDKSSAVSHETVSAYIAKENEKYIFVSYAHKDSNVVIPMISFLQRAGFLIWYDQGIEAGTEWPAYIEDRLNHCDKVLICMSPSAVASENCRNEINYACMLKKEMLIVYLEDTTLAQGMNLQLNSKQSLFRHRHPSEESFLNELAAARILQSCKSDASADNADLSDKVGGAAPVQPETPESKIAPLLKRAFMSLEDGEWKKADEYCERVLDIDPENAEAYLGKLMVNCRAVSREALSNTEVSFENNPNYKKALRFGGDDIKSLLEKCLEDIKMREYEAVYQKALNIMKRASSEEQFKAAAIEFSNIKDYKDSSSLMGECKDKADIAKKNSILAQGKNLMKHKTMLGYNDAIKKFESIRGWMDADEQIARCYKAIEDIKISEMMKKRRLEEARVQESIKAELARKAAEKRRKQKKAKAIAVGVVLCAVIAALIVLFTVVIPGNKYSAALALMDEGKYEDAITAFEQLGGYKDSENKIAECYDVIFSRRYAAAIALLESGDIIGAYDELIALGEYGDSAQKAASIYTKYKLEKIRLAKAGDTVIFGKYEQDNDLPSGVEDIEWLVLESTDGMVLLTSKYGLDAKSFNKEFAKVTWENCTLRAWLNDDFINDAFSSEEQEYIFDVSSITGVFDDNPDKVFLLDTEMVKAYFGPGKVFAGQMICPPTPYAVAQGLSVDSKGNSSWWLMDQGINESHRVVISHRGELLEDGYYVDHVELVRPVIIIDFSQSGEIK